MAAAKVKVRILPRRSVVIDGRARGEGAIVSVTKRDADALVAEGYASDSLTPPKPKPRRRPRRERPRKPLVLDQEAAELEPDLLNRG